jgi:hypothetical protein
MSEGVCEPRQENGSTEDRAAVCHLFVCVLNPVTEPTQQMENVSRPLEMMQCQKHKPFADKKKFSEGRILVEDEQRSGRPSATLTGDKTARVRELVRSD